MATAVLKCECRYYHRKNVLFPIAHDPGPAADEPAPIAIDPAGWLANSFMSLSPLMIVEPFPIDFSEWSVENAGISLGFGASSNIIDVQIEF